MNIETLNYIHDLLKKDYENKREAMKEVNRKLTAWEQEHKRYDHPYGDEHREVSEALDKSRRILMAFETHVWN